MTAEKPKYSSPAKTLRAADAARVELSGLTGEARRKQQDRVNELIAEAKAQNEAFQKANPEAGGSQIVNSARSGRGRSGGQASSPNGGAHRSQSRNSGKNKQITRYDPVLAKEQMAGQPRDGRGQSEPGQGNQGAGNADRKSTRLNSSHITRSRMPSSA